MRVPLVSVEHQLSITEAIPGVAPTLPTLRDPDRLTYYKEEVGGLVMGGYEPDPMPWALDGVPERFNFQLLNSDWDHFQQIMELAVGARAGAGDRGGQGTGRMGRRVSRRTAISFSARRRSWAGFSWARASTRSASPRAAARARRWRNGWRAARRPTISGRSISAASAVRRAMFAWCATRTLEAYAKHYAMAWPGEEHRSARPLRRSPLYDRLRLGGACFGEKMGWERPNWFAADGEEARDIYTYRPAELVRAGRPRAQGHARGVALFDESSFAKFLMVGRDAEAALSWICANDVARPPGSLTYTQMLNARGGIEADLTVSRLAADRFYIVTGTGFATHDSDWISAQHRAWAGRASDRHDLGLRHARPDGPALAGRAGTADRCDIANAAFPFGTLRQIQVAGAPVIALRLTYVGELGWELHVPTEFASPSMTR